MAVAKTEEQHVPHVLLVDGNSQQRDTSYKQLLEHGYIVTQADDVKSAAEQLKKRRYDILLLDLLDKGSEGFSLLKTIKTHKILSYLPVIMLCNQNEQQAEARAKKYGAALYLKKPVDAESLHKSIIDVLHYTMEVRKIENVKLDENDPASRNKLLQNIAAKLQKEEIQLPSAPKLLGMIISMLNDENASLTDIAALIEKEPSVSMRIIKAANSSSFAGNSQVRNTYDAVMRLGLKMMMNYVLIINNAQFFKFENATFKQIRTDLWKHSLMVAVCAKYIGTKVNFSQPDNLFAYGLLHDIGKFSLMRVIQELPQDNTTSDLDSIKLTFSKYHTFFGASLLEKWQFPKDFVDAAKYHHSTPIKGIHSKSLIITAYANTIVHALEEEGLTETRMSQLLREPHARILNVTQNIIKELPDEVAKEMEVLSSLI